MHLNKKERSLLGLASVFLGFLFFILIKAQGVAGGQVTLQETAIPSLIKTEQENQQLSVENEKIEQELIKYAQGQSASVLLNQQVTEAMMNGGLVELTGPGVQITLDDSTRVAIGGEDQNNYFIHEEYIREILNALWNGGAEAIAVNGQRVTTHTEVFCGGSFIQINGTRQMPPYVIGAIGDSRNLTAALKFYGWDRLGEFQEQYGITRKLEVLSDIRTPAGKLPSYRYAEPVKEGT
ncbi:DUF881 domain-containing protein [Desulfosporosinus sp.]|uniref:DUF881 domain-containing protein n=1 Tax=Desulfosporosinus sp. TaxID=157907 RepID=UPI000E99DCCC|nr:DUF881 domain-containing protein [Desulfosporosinus sp.]MBC2722153.1 DUF881 domain-containing protein [Desulfosporosinus sp.]MBC2727815.1 DUF881 domain-containing protein [Desulfosporosinus sp.]HBV86566.1 hypothetical protein [Desulfosporosinus sp.]